MIPVRPFIYLGKNAPLACGEIPLDALAKKYGTPLYVYSAEHLLYRLRLFTEAFCEQPHLICYAVKANPALAILRLLDRQGAGFDIVSGGELERIVTVNKSATARVVFSGVGKTAPEIDLALRCGILLFNVESEGELELLAERASKLRKNAPASPSASTPTSSPRPTLTSPPDSASTSSASTSAAPAPYIVTPPVTNGLNPPESAFTSAPRSAASSPSEQPQAASPTSSPNFAKTA